MNYEKPKFKIVNIEFKDIIALSLLPGLSEKAKEGAISNGTAEIQYEELFKF